MSETIALWVLEGELRFIWNKYESQRAAELDVVRTREEVTRELADLNAKRIKAGLPSLVEHSPQSFTILVGPQPKTWREEMDAELLSTVKRFLEQGSV